MSSLLIANLAPLMFLTTIVVLSLGYPIAFSLSAVGIGFFVLAIALAPHSEGAITLGWQLWHALPGRAFEIVSNETLLAIPFFAFMGIVLEKSRIAEDLLETVALLAGELRGGLAYGVIFVGAILAATTGVVAASVIAMGLISLKVMLRRGYDPALSSGLIVASGTLAQIVPPSLILIVMADQMGQSVGDMFRAAFIPSLVLIGGYVLYTFLTGVLRPASLPRGGLEGGMRPGPLYAALAGPVLATLLAVLALRRWFPLALEPAQVDFLSWVGGFALLIGLARLLPRLVPGAPMAAACKVLDSFAPPAGLIFIVLGSIFMGLATPTESGAIGAVAAVALAVAKGRLGWAGLYAAARETTRTAAYVMFILLASRIFSLTFYGLGGNHWVEGLFAALPGGETGFLIAVMVLFFVLGCFLDFFEIAFIVVPLVVPIADAFGLDPVWFGILIAINLQTSFLTPPFGFALFYFRKIAPVEPWADAETGRSHPGVPTVQIYRGALPFIGIQIAVLALFILWPDLMQLGLAAPAPVEGSVDIEIPGLDLGF